MALFKLDYVVSGSQNAGTQTVAVFRRPAERMLTKLLGIEKTRMLNSAQIENLINGNTPAAKKYDPNSLQEALERIQIVDAVNLRC